MYDVEETQITNALQSCRSQLIQMEKDGFLDKSKLTADDIMESVSGSSNLRQVLADAFYVQVFRYL